MKLVGLAVLLTVSAQSVDPVRHVDQALDASNDALLVTGTSVHTLVGTSSLSLHIGTALNLEPGIRLNRVDEAYTLATYDGKNVEIETGSDRVSLSSPVTLLWT